MKPVALIGAGAVGTALGRALYARGYPIRAVISRSIESAQRLGREVGAGVVSDDPAMLPPDARLVFCCVPDGEIGSVAAALRGVRADWSGTVVAHTSGALTASALAPLDEQGAALLTFHPVQTFPPESPPGAFEGIYVTLEGSAEGVEAGQMVARDLGAPSITISAEAKARYHLAASVASNFTVTLAAVAGEILDSVGIPPEDGRALLMPLLEATVRNLATRTPEQALTGPIVRGDVGTVRAHLDQLERHLPHLRALYEELGQEAVRLALRSGRLGEAEAEEVRRVLGANLSSSPPSQEGPGVVGSAAIQDRRAGLQETSRSTAPKSAHPDGTP